MALNNIIFTISLLFCVGIASSMLSGTVERAETVVDADFIKMDVTIKNTSAGSVIDTHSTVLKPIDGTLTLTSSIHILMDGEYKTLLKTDEIDFCQYIANPVEASYFSSIFHAAKKLGNLPTSCPIPAGKYNVEGFELGHITIPDMAPTGSYRLDILCTRTIGGKTHDIYKQHWYATIKGTSA